MFESIISDSSIQWWAVLICLVVALAMGLIFAILYAKLKQNDGYYKDMPICYALFPFIVTALIISITAIAISYSGSSDSTTARYLRAGGALLGCFLLLRFRSFPRNFEDLTYLFCLVGCGLLTGLGYLGYAAIFYGVIIIMFVVFHLTGFPAISSSRLNVKVTIPEDLNYEDAFDEIMKKYTTHYSLTKIKSSDMGTLFIINFEVTMKKEVSTKLFIDELRQRNGNLDIAVTKKKFMSEE